MANSVILQEQIITTVEKAKEARRVVDRLITLGKTNSLHSRRLAFDRTRDRRVVEKLFGTLADRYKARAGGYTRVLKLAERRWGDAAETAVLELVDHPVIDRKRKVKAAKAADAEAQTTTPDPLKAFKKMLGRDEKKAKTATPKAAKPPKTAKPAKAAATGKGRAGGGGSKSGGSS